MKFKIEYSNVSNTEDPVYAYKGDSGFDLRAWITQENTDNCVYNEEIDAYQVVLKPLERKLIHTGIKVNIPSDMEIQVRPRSGTALKKGLTVLNTPGTVDSNYTNTIGVIVINLSSEEITITNGDRIAQAVVMPVYNEHCVELKKVNAISENNSRNLNGFGSSGDK